MQGPSTGVVRLAALVAFLLALAAALALVLERIGVPPAVLAALAAGTVLALGVAAGLAGGTMRLPVFLLGGSDLPIAAVGVVLASVVAAGGGVHPLVALAALALWPFVVAPVIRRTGSPGLAGALGRTYRNGPLRILLAILVGGSALVFAAARIGDTAALLGPVLHLSAGEAISLVACTMALVLAPGGLSGAARAAVALGIAAVLSILSMATAAIFAGRLPFDALVQSVTLSQDGASADIMAVVAILVSPQLALLATAGSNDRSVREGSLWAALSAALLATLALALSSLPPRPDGVGLLPALAGLAAQSAVSLAAAMLAAQAAGLAFGYELWGRLDRRRHPTSRRFAQARAAVLVAVIGAALLAIWRAADLAGWQETCAVMLAATVGPPLLTAALLERPGRWSGLAGALGGAALAAALLDGRLVPGWSPTAAGLCGLAFGLVVGLPAGLLQRQVAPQAARLDEAAL